MNSSLLTGLIVSPLTLAKRLSSNSPSTKKSAMNSAKKYTTYAFSAKIGSLVTPSIMTIGQVTNIRTKPNGSGPTFLTISGENVAIGGRLVESGPVQSLNMSTQ